MRDGEQDTCKIVLCPHLEYKGTLSIATAFVYLQSTNHQPKSWVRQYFMHYEDSWFSHSTFALEVRFTSEYHFPIQQRARERYRCLCMSFHNGPHNPPRALLGGACRGKNVLLQQCIHVAVRGMKKNAWSRVWWMLSGEWVLVSCLSQTKRPPEQRLQLLSYYACL